jgi:pimeloyl-ACP methyl ester carboxylesterase
MAHETVTVGPAPRDLPHVADVEHRFVDANGVRIHVAEGGKPAAPPVLLLHGWPQHWYMWRRVIAGLADDFRLLAPDLRGFGWSEAPGHGYDGETLARDQVALLDALGIERVKLIGHDWGGWTAMLLGLLHAERIERMIVCNAAHPWPRRTPRLLAGQAPRSWYALAISIPGLGPRALRQGRLVRFLLRLWDESSPFTGSELDAYMQRFAEPARAEAASQLYRYYERVVRENATGRWRSHRLTVPTLMIAGEKDRALSKHLLPGFERHADDMRTELVPGAGHFLVDAKPDLVIARARQFLRAGSPRRAAGDG